MESCISLLKRLAYKEEKFPSNKMATGTWPFVNVRMSSSDFTDCKLTMAGVLIVLLLVSLANKIVFVIPLAFTVSIEEGKILRTWSKFFAIGLSEIVDSKG